jgi:hypothetical protein
LPSLHLVLHFLVAALTLVAEGTTTKQRQPRSACAAVSRELAKFGPHRSSSCMACTSTSMTALRRCSSAMLFCAFPDIGRGIGPNNNW